MAMLARIFFSFILVSWVFSSTIKKSIWRPSDKEELTSKVLREDSLNTGEALHKLKRQKKAVNESIDTGGAARGPGTEPELPTCLLCVCLSGSVYCEEVSPSIDRVPALPKETAYLYARFNKIKKIEVKDFSDIPTLKRIDLSGNLIEEIEDGAFSKLPLLEELSLAENRLVKIPALPAKLTSLNMNHNRIKNKGIKANVFKKLNNLSYLYLANNELESVPSFLPETLRILHFQNNNITAVSDETFCKSNTTHYIRDKLDEIRLEGNPVLLAKYPNSFTCLKNLPIGRYI
ncbi:osteoglycin, paralog a [Polypterus senegalus]|uniref:osteoglycin, paralog a n=1 Tax=Polypterus senegalus TaxID=55291 RepID=UPI0019648CC3|nr:osteoglycin, paralog a [Polypterus senegalus]